MRCAVGADETLSSIRKAAAYAGVASTTIHYWIETGRLRAESLAIGANRRTYSIAKADVEILIASKRQKDERSRAESVQRAAAAAAAAAGELPNDLVEAVAFHDRLLDRWRRSPASHKQYRHFLGLYLRFLAEAGVAPGLGALTPQLVGQCQDWMRRRIQSKRGGAVSESTFVRCIKAFARAMCEQGLYADDPLQRQKPVSAPKPERPPYTEAELRRLIEAAGEGWSQARDRALLLLLLDTGCRIGELCGADLGDLDLDGGSITFRRTKNGRPRQVRFGVLDSLDGGPCLAAVRTWLATRQVQPDEPLFINDQERRLTPKGAGRIIARIGREAGVPHAIAHRFRHTAATMFLSQRPGAEIQLRARLGHVSPDILQTYVHQTQSMAENGAVDASISSRLLASTGGSGSATSHSPAVLDDVAEQLLRRLEVGFAAELIRQEQRWTSLAERILVQLETLTEAVSRTGAVAEAASLRAPRSSCALELSERDGEVLQLLAQGVSAAAIARRLQVSVRTVNHHVEAICGKLDVDNRVQAITRAIELGLVAASAPTPANVVDLPPRQRAVLELLPTRLTQAQIAHRLGVTTYTVGHHLTLIYARLRARDRRSAVRRALELGLVQPHS